MSHSPQETQRWAAEWAKTLPRGSVIALHGDLGAGKTCLVQGLASGLHVTGPVHSPTFTLINEYQGPVPLYHLDLYRLRGEDDAIDIGVEQYLPGDGITAIEWAERIAPLLPTQTLHIQLDYGPDPTSRIITVTRPDAP